MCGYNVADKIRSKLDRSEEMYEKQPKLYKGEPLTHGLELFCLHFEILLGTHFSTHLFLIQI